MKTVDLYRQKHQCCGCELCSNVCPLNLIKMQPDDEGFLYPYIETDTSCLNCGKCLSVCPMKYSVRKGLELRGSYGGQAKKIDEVKQSSSGGLATAISQQFIKEGGIVVGVRYSSDFTRSVYDIADSIEKLESFRTSKYIQAQKGKIYHIIKKEIKRKILFIGLPCEVSALYNYLGHYTDNLYTISLICHGPTTPLVQNDYCNQLQRRYNSKITSFSVRHKEKGWKPYYLKAEFENGRNHKELFKGCSYEIAFQYLKRPSCYSCRYKLGDIEFGLVADMTLGDFHAVEDNMPCYNAWGVSQLSVQSEKASYLLELAKRECNLLEIPENYVRKYNYAFHYPSHKKRFHSVFKKLFLKKGLNIAANNMVVVIPYFLTNIKKKIKSNLYNMKTKITRKRHG